MIIIPFSFDTVLGMALVLFGSNFIIKALFGIDIPFMRFMIGLLLIFWGLSMFTSIEFAPSKHFKKKGKRVEFTVEVDRD